MAEQIKRLREDEKGNSDASTLDLGSIRIFLVKEGIQPKRHGIISSYATKNGVNIDNMISELTTHVLTELDDFGQMERLYNLDDLSYSSMIVTPKWLFDSLKIGKLQDESSYYVNGFQKWKESRNKKTKYSNSDSDQTVRSGSSKNGAQKIQTSIQFCKRDFNKHILERKAPIVHFNPQLVDALEFLSNYWSIHGDEMRFLAFRKAAATVHSIPFKVCSIEEVSDLKELGDGHAMKVISELLDTGQCVELQMKKESEKYKALKNLTDIYGVGAALANKLYSTYAVTSVEQVVEKWKILKLSDERIKFGVAFYTDLNTPVTREEVRIIQEKVESVLQQVKPGFCVEVTGGFRRGKDHGHDVDLLITYNQDGEEKGVLATVLKLLASKGYILHTKVEASTLEENQLFQSRSSKSSMMDHFEKCFLILKVPTGASTYDDFENEPRLKSELSSLISVAHTERRWRAARVDLVLVPQSQWAYALLGWTGSKMFMRMIRHHANKMLNMLLNSHGLYSRSSQSWLKARTEEEIFIHLGLQYKKPSDRNF